MYRIKLLTSFIYEMKLVLIVQNKRRGKPSLTPNQTEHFVNKILEMSTFSNQIRGKSHVK